MQKWTVYVMRVDSMISNVIVKLIVLFLIMMLMQDKNKAGTHLFALPPFLVPLGVEINPQFYWGKIKSFSI